MTMGISSIWDAKIFPAVSSVAVMDHLVGTIFLFLPKSPKDNSLDMLSTSAPEL